MAIIRVDTAFLRSYVHPNRVLLAAGFLALRGRLVRILCSLRQDVEVGCLEISALNNSHRASFLILLQLRRLELILKPAVLQRQHLLLLI